MYVRALGNFCNQPPINVFKEPPHSTGAHTGAGTSQHCPATPRVIAMAQAYYPSRAVSPAKQAFHESVFGGLHGDKQLNVEDVQEAYVESKDR